MHYGLHLGGASELIRKAVPALFYYPAERLVIERIHELADAGRPMDPALILAQLDAQALDAVGGRPAALAALMDASCPSEAHAHAYIAALAELAGRRRLLDAATRVSRGMVDGSLSVAAAGELAERMAEIARRSIDTGADRLTDAYQIRWGALPALADPILGIMPPSGATLFYADPKMGKSMLAQQIEQYLAVGIPIFRRGPEIDTPGVRCLVIDHEGDDHSFRARSFNMASEQINEEDFALIKVAYPGRNCEIGDTFDERYAWLASVLDDAAKAGEPFGYVRIDTAIDFIGPKDKGSDAYSSYKPKVTRLNQLAKTHELALVLVHHTSKDGRVNGSQGAWEGGVEAIWRLERIDPGDELGPVDPSRQFGRLVVFGRSLPPTPPLTVELREDGWQLIDGGPSPSGLSELRGQIWGCLKLHGPQTVDQLKGRPEFHRASVGGMRNALAQLWAERFVECDHAAPARGRRGPRPRVWWVETAPTHTPEPMNQTPEGPSYTPEGPSYASDRGNYASDRGSYTPDLEPAPDVSPGQGVAGEDVAPDPVDPMRVSEGAVSNSHRPAPGSVASEAGAGCEPAPAAPGPAPSQGAGPSRKAPSKAVEALHDSLNRARSKRPVRLVPHDEREREPWSLRIQQVGDHAWLADLGRYQLDGRAVVVLDRRGSYPSAMSSVVVGSGMLLHRGPLTEDELGRIRKGTSGRAGLYLIDVPAWLDASFSPPLGRHHKPGQRLWVTDPHLDLLRRPDVLESLEKPVTVLDSWLSLRATTLFRPFAEWAQARRLETAGTEAADRVKKDITRGVQMLASRQESGLWRPDWAAAIQANAYVRHWVKARAAHQRLGHVIALRAKDEVHLLLDEDQAADVAQLGPDQLGYQLGPRFGDMSLKAGPFTLDEWRATYAGPRRRGVTDGQ